MLEVFEEKIREVYPQRDILEKLIACFKDPKVGAVQGRVTVLNEPNTLVTRLIALERTGGYRVDQFARDNLGLIPQFGGTVVQWRYSRNVSPQTPLFLGLGFLLISHSA